MRPRLYVDMDGTLLRGDSLIESLVALVRENPIYIFAIPIWLASGKANLKHQVALRSPLDASTLPHNPEFVSYLRDAHETGRSIALITGANERWAGTISSRFGWFDEVICSTASVNLSPARKLAEISRRSETFEYAGNAIVDVPLFERAERGICVRPTAAMAFLLRSKPELVKSVMDSRKNFFASAVRLMRIHQWSKNLLVFVPLLLSHSFDLVSARDALTAFIALSLLASATYIVNDISDLQLDRVHPIKKGRPLASGEISLVAGLVLMTVLFSLALLVSQLLSTDFRLALLAYLVATLSYSFLFKRLFFLDVLVLAGLYTHRVIIGAIAITVVPSIWLLAFSMFFFLSLALMKRVGELASNVEAAEAGIPGRAYASSDRQILLPMGVSSGFISILVIALYLNEAVSAQMYSSPAFIWVICPVLLYWVSRMWSLAVRGQMKDDPIEYALADPVSWLSAGLITLSFVSAIYVS